MGVRDVWHGLFDDAPVPHIAHPFLLLRLSIP